MRFKLGTFSGAGIGAAPWPGLVLEGDRVVPLARTESLLRRLNLKLRKSESLLSLLSEWDSHFQALAILCESMPEELAKLALAVDELHTRAPIDPPRQIFCSIANYRSHIIEAIL